MTKQVIDRCRRRFIKMGFGSIVAVPVTSLLVSTTARAELVLLDENDTMAKNLGYRHDTNAVDRDAYPNHSPEQLCSNCKIYLGQPGDPQGACTIFPGKAVKASGWCSAWVAKG